MKIILNMLLISFVVSSVLMLCSCTNTANGMSQDVNRFSDSVHRAVNS